MAVVASHGRGSKRSATTRKLALALRLPLLRVSRGDYFARRYCRSGNPVRLPGHMNVGATQDIARAVGNYGQPEHLRGFSE